MRGAANGNHVDGGVAGIAQPELEREAVGPLLADVSRDGAGFARESTEGGSGNAGNAAGDSAGDGSVFVGGRGVFGLFDRTGIVALPVNHHNLIAFGCALFLPRAKCVRLQCGEHNYKDRK
ncbi:hypothetical protein Ga0100230_011285 [Opitutaceae bacterium TAV3]|nr:hypothetical protein Ga0100230_011285 [Opitutaceae bacterium TAV3]